MRGDDLTPDRYGLIVAYGEVPPARSPVEATATVEGRPRSLNAERRGSTWAHRQTTREAVERWSWAWREVGAQHLRLARVEVEAFPALSGAMQDTGNCYPTVKAAVDALVLLGALPGDGPDEVAWIRLHAPVRVPPKRDALTVTVREVVA